MTKRAMIAEPDQEEALRQAAILKDDGYEALVFTGSDLVAAVEQSPPDVLVLRHERPGNQTGIALVPRLKGVAPGTAIVLTTSDLTPDAIEKNKKQKVHADWYLRLPADRGELVGAARAVPQVLAADEAAAEEEKPKQRDPSRPPPLPPSGLRSLAQLPKAAPRSGDAVLTAEDLTFVEKVFSSIQHIDADAPIQDPAPSAIGDIPDRKLALLRTKLKERERDLAKLSRLWRAREEDLRQQESKVQQKDIEVEGLKLRITELTGELEHAQQTLVEKEAEWGKQIGETYDQHSLNEAELIQQVAGKEAELNTFKTKLRKTEDAAAAERKEFTTRVLEWEKAYADFDQHHWKIIASSVEEMERLQQQLAERERSRGELKVVLRERENTIAKLQADKVRLKDDLFAVEHLGAVAEERVFAAAQAVVVDEHTRRLDLEDELAEARAMLLLLEEDLAKHQKLLWWLDQQRLAQIASLAVVVREGEAERARLSDEREIYRQQARELEASLSTSNALGEAVAATMFALDDKKSIVAREQVRVRDEKLSEFAEDIARLSGQVEDLTGRLGQSEMDHAAENARADELERDLADTRERAATTETRLQGALDGMTGERDRLSDKLSLTDQNLATTREDLSTEKHSRQQRELEIGNLLERKENELADRTQRIADLDRSLADAKEDIANLRKTMSTRDERITELLNRVRQADEKQVQLEGQIFRLESSNSEREATIISRDERIAALSDKITQREDRIEVLDVELKKTQSAVLDAKAQVERHEAHIAEVQKQLAGSRDETTATRAELQQRSNDLFESERKASNLTAELQNARAEIQGGNAIAEQLQTQLAQANERGAELRRTLEDTNAKLRASLLELDAAGKRADQIRTDLANTKEVLAGREAEINEKSRLIADVERGRNELQATLATTRQMLEMQITALEGDKAEVEEQLSQELSRASALEASLSDAARRIEEIQGRARQLEAIVADREGRIAAQGQVLTKAEQTTTLQQQALTEREEELAEVKNALDEARRSVDERAKWVATRDAAIAELKATLEHEKKGAGDVSEQARQTQEALKQAQAQAQALQQALQQKDQQLTAASSSTNAAVVAERTRADEARLELQRQGDRLTAAEAELVNVRAEAARAAEFEKKEAHVRAEFQKLRAQAEKILADNKASKALIEKIEGEKKAALDATEKLRAEIADARNQAGAGAQQAAQAKQESDARAKELADLKAQLQRAAQQTQLAQKAKQEADADIENLKKQADADRNAAIEAQQVEVTRLTKELLDARKAQRDAVAQAQQAKAEAEQIKKMAAQRLAQTKPPTAAAPSTAPAPVPKAAPAVGAASVVPQPARAPMTAESNPFDSPTVVAAAGSDPFDAQKTVMVDRPVIPSQARGGPSKT